MKIVSLGHKLAGDASCLFTAPGDLPATDPRLAGLPENGGPTRIGAVEVAGAPAPRSCASRRTVACSLPGGARRVRLQLDGRSAPPQVAGRRLTISFAGLPRGALAVRITARSPRPHRDDPPLRGAPGTAGLR